MFLDPEDSLQISTYGFYEEFETELVKKIIQKNYIVLDIGANIGYYTLLFAKLVGDNGKVFAFEPEPNNFALLKKNTEINGYRNVALIQKAISNRTGKTKLYVNERNAGGHTIYNSYNSCQMVDVDVTKLDDYLDTSITTVNFAKIDVEGSEFGVIEGMKNLLQKTKDFIIMSEFNPSFIKKYGKEPEDYVEILLQHGFKFYHIDSREKTIKEIDYKVLLKKYTAENKGYTNLLCVKGKPQMTW